MHGATHFTAGIAAGLGVATLTGETDPARLALSAALGGVVGLVPDWLQINVPGASRQLKGTFGHRGFSHWLWTPLLISLLVIPTNAPNGLRSVFLASWVSHIALDVFADGAPVFWPFGRLTLAHVKTGGKLDKLTGGAFLVLACMLAIGHLLAYG